MEMRVLIRLAIMKGRSQMLNHSARDSSRERVRIPNRQSRHDVNRQYLHAHRQHFFNHAMKLTAPSKWLSTNRRCRCEGRDACTWPATALAAFTYVSSWL